MTTYIGVDASLTRTAFAALPGRTYGLAPTTAATPLHMRLRRIAEESYDFVAPFAELGPVLVVVEVPGFIPEGHGIESIYALGRAQGAVLAGLPALPNVRALTVTVAAVRAGCGLVMRTGQHKQIVQDYVRARGIALPDKRGGETDDDVADAYLLAVYATLTGEAEGRPRLPVGPLAAALAGMRRGRGR